MPKKKSVGNKQILVPPPAMEVEVLGPTNGRPSTYKPEYCDMLVKHRSEGYSFESFGAVINAHRDTLYEWAKVHENFSDAKKRGLEQCSKFYEDLGKLIATGQLRRLKSRTPVFTPDGKVVTNQNGEPVYKEEYEPAVANSTAWIFLTKNLLGWRDRREIGIMDPNSEGTLPLQKVPDQELVERFQRFLERKQMKALNGDTK